MNLEIKTLDDLIPHIKDKPEIRIKQENGFYIVSYMISNQNTFDNDYALECRGITFNYEGKIICRPYQKFFNVNEREDTQQHNIDWNNVISISDKVDGSMITPVLIDNKIRVKTKKSFSSDVAKLAQQFVDEKEDYQNFCYDMIEKGYTPIFEWVSPKSRVVINHEDDNLILLNIRHMVTGEYMPEQEVKFFAKEWNIPVTDKHVFQSPEQLITHCHNAEGIEGYVVQFEDGNFVKFKTPWYLKLHHAVSFIRERDIAEMVLDETIDDKKSYLNELGVKLDNVLEIENRVYNTLIKMEHDVENICQNNKHLSKKEFVMKFKEHPLFSLLIKEYDGWEVPYKEYFRKNILKKEYSLNQL